MPCVTAAPETYIVPPGFKLVPAEPVKTHPLAFRPTQDEIQMLAALRATLPSDTWQETIRWVLNQPVVREVILDRIRSAGGAT